MLKIITNNVPRNLKYGYEMPENLRADFDYIEADEFDGHDFVEYKGNWYDCSEFMRIENNEEIAGWDGYVSDSYFSGILIRYSGKPYDYDQVIMGRFYS